LSLNPQQSLVYNDFDRKLTIAFDLVAIDRQSLIVIFLFCLLSLEIRGFIKFIDFYLDTNMTGLGDIVQKAFYLGVGLAAYGAEKAGTALQELRVQAQKLADEMVERGEMTAEEARKYVDDMIQQAQQETIPDVKSDAQTKEPRTIEIIVEDEDAQQSQPEDIDDLRDQVQSLQDELRNLKRDS
jgi:polyhydroxyalkanoate synthesis regulator phasin